MAKELLMISAPGCAPCASLKPQVAREAEARAFPYRLVEACADPKVVAIIRRFGVRHVPILILLEDDVELDRFVGASITASQLSEKLDAWGLGSAK